MPATGRSRGTPARVGVDAQMCVLCARQLASLKAPSFCCCVVQVCLGRLHCSLAQGWCAKPTHGWIALTQTSPGLMRNDSSRHDHLPASSMARQPPHTEAMEEDPLDSVMVLSTRTCMRACKHAGPIDSVRGCHALMCAILGTSRSGLAKNRDTALLHPKDPRTADNHRRAAHRVGPVPLPGHHRGKRPLCQLSVTQLAAACEAGAEEQNKSHLG